MFFGLLMSIFYLKNPHKGKKQKGFFYVFPLSCIHSCHRTLNYQIHKSQRVARVLQPSFHRVTRCKSMPPNSFIVQFFSNFSKNFFNFSLQKLFLQNRLRDLRIRLRKKHFRLREFEVTGETRRWQHSCNRFCTEKQRVNFRWQECKEFRKILWKTG